MCKNYMSKIAEMFGLELGEKFDIENCSYNPYKFTEDGLFDSLGNSRSTVLERLLNGTVAIIKKPWKPYYNDTFYAISPNDGVRALYWGDSLTCKLYYLSGNCFKTKEEAEKNIEAYYKYLEAKEPDTSWRVDS